jgi:hypothetical protein
MCSNLQIPFQDQEKFAWRMFVERHVTILHHVTPRIFIIVTLWSSIMFVILFISEIFYLFYQWHIVFLSTCTFCFHMSYIISILLFLDLLPFNFFFFRITSLYISRSYLIYISYKQTMNIHRYNASLAKLETIISKLANVDEILKRWR